MMKVMYFFMGITSVIVIQASEKMVIPEVHSMSTEELAANRFDTKNII